MSIFFGLLFARRLFCCPALSLSPGRTGGLFPRINAPIKTAAENSATAFFIKFYLITLTLITPSIASRAAVSASESTTE